jgi:hypothetical protein
MNATMNATMNDYVQLTAFDLETLREKIAILNKKATKLGCEPAKVKVLDEVIVKRSKVMPGGRKITYEVTVFNVTVVGSTPKLAGWSLVAKVEFVGDEKLISCVPGETCPAYFRTNGLYCDHCNSARRRKTVYVLKHDDGRHVQVGRQCIKDFLGGKSPEQLLAQAAWGFSVSGTLGEAGDGWGGGDHVNAIDMVEYLNAVAICIRRLGWVSKAKAQYADSATAGDAWYLMRPPVNETARKKYERWVEVNNLHHQERDEKLAAEALEWAKALSTTGNDYLYNLGVACRAGFVLQSTSGIVASLISAYLRAQEREEEIAQRKSEDAKKSREWLGEVKVRQNFEKLTVTKMVYIPGAYGTTTLVIFEDEPGNIIKWFASVKLDDLEEGDVVDIKATVKKHDEYNEQKQTLVTRAKILEKVA